MSRDIEDLLRSAYQAKAESVTEQRLAQLETARDQARSAAIAVSDDATVTRLDTVLARHDEVTRRAGSRNSRWIAPALAAAAVVVVAAGALAVANTHDGRGVNPQPPATHVSLPTAAPTTAAPKPTAAKPSVAATSTAPSNTAPSNTIVPLLARGKQQTAASIPWDQVGTGWTVALWTPETKPMADVAGPVRDKPERVYLVNPIGGRYLVALLPAGKWDVLDWSGDGRRVLLSPTRTGGPFRDSVSELDVATGQIGRAIPVGASVDEASYTRPLGKAILLSGQDAAKRIALDGTLEHTYPASYGQLGLFDNPLESPDGTEIVFATSKGLAVYTNAGTFIRTVPTPAGFGCGYPLRWWAAGIVAVPCGSSSDTRILLFDVDGSTYPQLPTTTGHGSVDGALLGNARYVFGAASSSTCGTAVTELDPTDPPQTVHIALNGGQPVLLGATQSALLVGDELSCGSPRTLESYSPSTGATTVLLGGSLNGGTVISALLFDRTDPPR